MDAETIDKIKTNPHFKELVSKRSSFGVKLAISMLVIYYSFILVVAFFPGVLGMAIGNGVMTVGIPVGIAIIFSAFILTGLYVSRANSEFDTLTQKIKDDLRDS